MYMPHLTPGRELADKKKKKKKKKKKENEKPSIKWSKNVTAYWRETSPVSTS
jgi:hypothetical protein